MGGARGVDRQDVSGVFQLLVSSEGGGPRVVLLSGFLPTALPSHSSTCVCLPSPCSSSPACPILCSWCLQFRVWMVYHSSTQNRKETEATVVKGLAHAPGLERGKPGMKAAISSSVHSDTVATPCLAQGLMGCQDPCSQKGSRALPGDSGAHRVSCCWWFDCHC